MIYFKFLIVIPKIHDQWTQPFFVKSIYFNHNMNLKKKDPQS